MSHKTSRYDRGVDTEIMPGRIGASKAGFNGGGLELTHDLVQRAETKLISLQTNRSQLRRRIRALHYLLKTLHTNFSALDSPDPVLDPVGEVSRFNQDESSRLVSDSDTGIEPSIRSNEETITAPPQIGISTELRRACRIALMESDRPQDCKQILQRIRRRNSVCLEGFHDPLMAIAEELGRMMADGEVFKRQDGQLWQLNRDSIAQRKTSDE